MARQVPADTHRQPAGDRPGDSRSTAGVSRRGLMAGAGAAVLATSVVAGVVPEADASPTVREGAEVGARPAHPDGAPIATSIGSAPISGYVYRTACMYDFRPFNPAAQPTWGGSGVYTAGTAGVLRATLELPPGVIVRDVEFYVANSGSTNVTAELWQYAPGQGLIFSMGAVAIAPGTGITATRTAIGATSAGPFPMGSRLLAGLNTPTDATVQINGARIGFSSGAGATAVLPAPIRAYDSRVSGGKLAAGSTRTVTLPASAIPAGATAALINLVATAGTTTGGYLKVYAASASEPTASAINFGTASIANALTVGVSNARQIKVFTNRAVDVVIDVTGYVS